jgi:hypothetical protein
MKASTSLSPVYNCLRRITLVGVLAVSFFVSRPSPAQYTYIPGTCALNVYFNDTVSGTYPGEFDPTPDLANGPCTPVEVTDLDIGAELTAGSFFSFTIPGSLGGGTFPTYNSGSMVLGTASASVNYFPAPFLTPSNSVSQSSITPFVGQISLNNTGTGIAELRLDWTAQFTYSGTTPIAASVGGVLNIDLGDWVAVAGGITFYDITISAASSTTIGMGGDFPFHGYPSALSTYSPNGVFWGLNSAYSAAGLRNGFLGGTGGTINPASGDVIETVGFIDLLVDPGSLQLSITPAPAPLLHSAHASGTNLLVDVQNGVVGVSYVTCRSTSVSAPLSTWLPVATNIPSSTGNFNFTATNAVDPAENAAFFVIRAQ